ncbi:hypothetical protein ACQ1Q5_00350 [Ornithobacterium rhinotracheale]
MKNLTLKKVLTFSLFFLGVFGMMLLAQANDPDLKTFNQAMNEGNNLAKNVSGTIKNIVYIVGGIAALIYLITALVGGRDGDDKVKKFGTWMLVVAFVALGTFIVTKLFGI